MKTRSILHDCVFVFGAFILSGFTLEAPAFSQDIGQLISVTQRTRTVINNNAAIDDSNPENVTFSTNIDGQLVELNLTANRINDSFITAINYPQSRSIFAVGGPRGVKGTAPQTMVTFGDLHIVLDGCDVSSALLTQCISNACWDVPGGSISPAPTTWNGIFGTYINLNLSALNPQNITGCTAAPLQTSFFDAAHPSHTLQFFENITGLGKGGSLNYQVILFNKAY